MSLFSLRPATQLWPPVLLGSQFVFNIGFYAVVPFLAIFLRDDMLLSGGLIGLVLGLRTFSQQGMFIVGGALSDRYGAKVIILCGCVIRVVGYLLLAFGTSLGPIILGACLTGIGGALFSPSIEALLAKAGSQSETQGKRSRAEWFALFAVCGELGAVLGPVAGALLTGLGFRQVALAGAGVFIIALVVLFFCLPSRQNTQQTLAILPWWTTFRQPRFVAFIIAYSSWLLSYNQLYLALPVEIQRAGGSEKDLGPLFMLASVLIIAFQLPLARFARRAGAARIIPIGFLLLSASFLSVACFAATEPAEGWMRLLPSACFVSLLTLGQMLIVPAAKDLIPWFAQESTLGAHYGALSTAGGCAVLAGNLVFGSQLDHALTPSTAAIYPWLLLAFFPLCSAIALVIICRPVRASLARQP
ncbi:MFS transporter [Enterobacter sp. RHBSTW-00994]|uniref:MDR family MFS transporter n=1 Tax=Enterobacter sp. RHBSTW-00994 TaxID=2742676 RepID=UPI0015E8F5C6|nr:MFS transporter [Enterobacter sp. RHBSTW-00994]QLR44374.1 MFS transporter [Enterobacter sp. RHBSTW-00994]